MVKQVSSLRSLGLAPYFGILTPKDAATAIQAARLNALDLLSSAKLLHDQKHFNHSTALCVLALEEAGKVQILMSILTGVTGTDQSCESLWRAYRRHTAKTERFNFAIEIRAGVHFPEMEEEKLTEIGASGPTPEDLDAIKQLGLYSDCFKSPEGVAVHLPCNLDCSERSRVLLGEATVVITSLRDYTPDELEVWARHAAEARAKGISFRAAMKPLYLELLEKRYITEEQWSPIWNYLAKIEQQGTSIND